MLTIERRNLTKWAKCSCCGEQKRTCEPMNYVVNAETGKDVRGERYCDSCVEQGYAHENNPGITEDSHEDDAENRAERMAEHFAAHRAAGVSTETAWDNWNYDQHAGEYDRMDYDCMNDH